MNFATKPPSSRTSTEFREWRRERNRIHLLKTPLFPNELYVSLDLANTSKGQEFDLACSNPARTWRTPGPPDADAYSWFSGEVSIGARGVDGGLFVAEGEEADAEMESMLSDVGDGEAGETEEDADVEVVEGLGDDLGSGGHFVVDI